MKIYKNIPTLCKVLKTARVMAGLTQAQLAIKLKTAQPSVSKMESGEFNNLKFAEKMVNACGFNLRLNHITLVGKEGDYTFHTEVEEVTETHLKTS